MASQSTLEILIKLKDEATENLSKFGSSFKSAEGASKAFGIGIAAAGASVVAFGYSAVKASGEAQAQIASMDATLTSMGKSGTDAREKIMQMSGSLLRLGVDDEDAAVSIAKLYQRTGDLTQAQNLNNLAMDLSRAKHLGLEEASKLVGLTLSGNGRMLKQYGIDIKETASPMEALAELQNKVGGQAEAFANTYEGQMEVLKQTTQNFREEVGKYLLPALTGMLKAILPIIDGIIEWVSDIKNLQNFLKDHEISLSIIAGAIIGGLVPAMSALAMTMVMTVIPAFLAAAVALAPFLIGGAIIGGVVAGVLWLIKNWELVKQKAGDVWDWIKNHIMGISVMLGPAGVALAAIGEGVMWVINNWNTLQAKTIEIFTAIKDFFVGIWDSIKNIFGDAINWITNKFNDLMSLVDKVKSAASSVGNFASNAVNSVTSAITGKRAEGGPVASGNTYLVGENGPELFTPGASGNITPNDQLTGGRLMPSSGGTNIVVNISGNNIAKQIDIRNLADQVSNAIVGRLKLNQKLSI